MASSFPGLSAAQVQALQNADTAIAVIASRKTPTSFNWMRERFKEDHDLKDSLDWGKAILSTVEQLNQYLYTYGKMICAQWQEFTADLTFEPMPLRVVDYGCGQGLAAIALSDAFGATFRSSVVEVLLIEPSPEAIIRAEAVYRNLFPSASIVCLQKKLDELAEGDFHKSSVKTLHIFSNILDITGFDLGLLFNLLLTQGEHVIMAVSHNRDFAGGAGRLRAIKEALDKDEHRKWLKVRDSVISEFNCGDGGKFAAIGWSANLSIDRE